MRVITLLIVVLAASASRAQSVASPAERLPSGSRVVVTTGALAGGLVAMVATGTLLGNDWDKPLGATLIAASYPLGAVLSVQGLNALYGVDAPWLVVAQDVVLGAAGGIVAGGIAGGIGAGVGYLVELAVTGNDSYAIVGPALGAVVAGGTVGVTTAVLLTTRSLRVTPAALAAPTGERATGLSLTLRL